MPHLTLTIMKLIAVLPPNSVYVSIYESNSKDETGLKPITQESKLGVLQRFNTCV